jgi:hypothetical protein
VGGTEFKLQYCIIIITIIIKEEAARMVVHACNSSYSGGRGRRIMV